MTEKPENIAETMRRAIEEIGLHETIEPNGFSPFDTAHHVTVPEKRRVHDLTRDLREAAQYLKPWRRRGTAKLADMPSLVAWANRFKGEGSVLFADPDMTAPKLTCIANYHEAGAPVVDAENGDATASHCDHRAVYGFPMSKEWQAWMEISDTPLTKDELGEFIEANAKDIMDPTPAMLKGEVSDKNEPSENRLIETAQRIEGRFGQLSELLQMSKRFAVYETSDLKVVSNRDTGEQEIQFLNEHKDKDGAPLRTPNLITIAIPVFLNGMLYRMAVRFRYRKSGSTVVFILSIYTPEKVFEACFDDAVQSAVEQTGLPLFVGSPET